MTEAEIATQLQKTISPPDSVLVSATPVSATDTTYGQATTAPNFQLDEMAQYKLQDYFGEQYKDSDEVKRQQVQYIYEEIAKQIDNHDYGFVVAKLRDLERIIGVTHSEDRLYKVYQWLKLDKTRRSIEAELGAISNG